MSQIQVLLADDHAVVRAGIRNAIESMQNITIAGEVGDGDALQQALDRQHIDLLLIDVTMPNFQPIVVIREIRMRFPDMKILVVSAYDDDIYVQGLLRAGVNGYHLKDQPLQDLQLAIERILTGKRWISSRLVDNLIKSPQPTLPVTPLTPRQCEILRLLEQGFDNRTIAQNLGLSIKTVENHLTRLYRQLNVNSRLEAVSFIREHPELIVLHANPAPSAEIKARPHAPHSQSSILVVDDNGRYRSQIRRIIDRSFPQAIINEAQNTAEAMHVVGYQPPSLAFVDVVLGDEDGIRCTKRIKDRLPNARIILMSAYPDREFRRRGIQAGATVFIDKKDLDAAAIRQIIQDSLS